VRVKPQRLTDKLIADKAANVLQSIYGNDLDNIPLPIDVDSIVELLGADLVFDSFNNPDILGAAIPGSPGEKHQIQIASFLADDESQEARYRFTVSHEIGHMILHFPLLPLNNGQMNLLDSELANREPIAFCRAVDIDGTKNQSEMTDYDWQERQANVFGANLLMPEFLLKKSFDACIKEIGQDAKDWEGVDLMIHYNYLIQKLKSVCNVSFKAMEVRISKLRLFEVFYHGLFGERLGW
jgi:hypothetical protein